MPTDAISRFQSEYQQLHQISRARSREQIAVLREIESLGDGDIFASPAHLLREFQLSRMARGNSPATVGKLRKMVRPFYSWAYEVRLMSASDLAELLAVRGPRGCSPKYTPRPYARDQVKLLWKDFDRKFPVDPQAAHWVHRYGQNLSPFLRVKPIMRRAQTRAILALALCGGLRRREIFSLRLNDLHYDNAYLVVQGARKNEDAEIRERAVPWVADEMREWVREWIDLRAIINPQHDSPWLSLWSTDGHFMPMSCNRFDETMTRLGRGWEFHRLRHTAATEMLRAGYPLETVQRILGHSSIQQTLCYAQLLPDDIVRVAARSTMTMSAALMPEKGAA